ncbi:hypothetical protein AB0M22_38770 [Nocardia sp. NPDC051756]|uniref:hypothetical protein n=1 Tax=Nocardia sp. NPDC051756 TaxID=3154751 RepID=UPI003438A0F7
MKIVERIAASAAAVTAIAGMFVVAMPTVAQADPGRCGVSVEGPSNGGSLWAYYVKNVCSEAINVKVHLYVYDKDTTCRWIVPGDTVALFSNYIDNNWQAVAC